VGAEQVKLKALTSDLGSQKTLLFTGFIPNEDLPVFYASSDCFVIAGIAELQSIVTMEAMASGLPVIGVNAVALPELIHHQENGFVYEEGDSKSLSGFISTIFSDKALHEKMSQKSLEIYSITILTRHETV